jgi:hypothetical protein
MVRSSGVEDDKEIFIFIKRTFDSKICVIFLSWVSLKPGDWFKECLIVMVGSLLHTKNASQKKLM